MSAHPGQPEHQPPQREPPAGADVTRLLADAAAGDPSAPHRLLTSVYEHLRAAAQLQMHAERLGGAGHTLSATALVHEAYLKLVGPREIPWANRAHFYAAAVEAMRRRLVDHARAKHRQKRGGPTQHRVDLDQAPALPRPDAADNAADAERVLALDDAFRRLEDQDPPLAAVAKFRFYIGLSVQESALALGVSECTIKTDWVFAKAWLSRELGQTPPQTGATP